VVSGKQIILSSDGHEPGFHWQFNNLKIIFDSGKLKQNCLIENPNHQKRDI
jgi:hypothetical protein